jgi:hypothetical protein
VSSISGQPIPPLRSVGLAPLRIADRPLSPAQGRRPVAAVPLSIGGRRRAGLLKVAA